LGWDDVVVCDHDSSDNDVEENSHFDVLGGVDRKVVIEFGGLLVKFDQQKLVNPVKTEIEDDSEWVENRHSCREHKNAPKISIVLSIHIVARNLVSSVKGVELILQVLFGVHFVVA
jgi:hypothetical protein